ASRNANVNRFRAPNTPFTAAILAGGPQLSRAAAAIARHIKPHLASSLLNRPRAVARRAGLRRPDSTRAVAHLAGIQTRDLKLFYRAAHRIPEIDLQFVFQRAASFGFFFHGRSAPAKKAAKKIAKARSTACAT